MQPFGHEMNGLVRTCGVRSRRRAHPERGDLIRIISAPLPRSWTTARKCNLPRPGDDHDRRGNRSGANRDPDNPLLMDAEFACETAAEGEDLAPDPDDPSPWQRPSPCRSGGSWRVLRE